MLAMVEELITELKSGLARSTRLIDVARIDYATTTIARRNILELLVRTTSPLSDLILESPLYQTPGQIIINNVLILGTITERIANGTINLMPSEAMRLARFTPDRWKVFNVTFDESRGIVTFPEVKLPRNERERKRLEGQRGNRALWLKKLLDDDPTVFSYPCLSVTYLPDLLDKDMDDAALGKAIEVSIGENYLRVGDDALKADFCSMLRRSLSDARLLISFE